MPQCPKCGSLDVGVEAPPDKEPDAVCYSCGYAVKIT